MRECAWWDRVATRLAFEAGFKSRAEVELLAFIGVAQSAGFKLTEIKDLVHGVDGADGMASQIRALSSRKLAEVNALLERTKAMQGWLEVAKDCGCQTPDECALFPPRRLRTWIPTAR